MIVEQMQQPSSTTCLYGCVFVAVFCVLGGFASVTSLCISRVGGPMVVSMWHHLDSRAWTTLGAEFLVSLGLIGRCRRCRRLTRPGHLARNLAVRLYVVATEAVIQQRYENGDKDRDREDSRQDGKQRVLRCPFLSERHQCVSSGQTKRARNPAAHVPPRSPQATRKTSRRGSVQWTRPSCNPTDQTPQS
jgi:hypothetical protein